jgi:hypothetical protein
MAVVLLRVVRGGIRRSATPRDTMGMWDGRIFGLASIMERAAGAARTTGISA